MENKKVAIIGSTGLGSSIATRNAIGAIETSKGPVIVCRDNNELEKIKNEIKTLDEKFQNIPIILASDVPELALRSNDIYLHNNYTEELLESMEDIQYSHLSRKEKEADIKPIRNSKVDPKIGNNEICPCGSNKKYKKCCKNG